MLSLRLWWLHDVRVDLEKTVQCFETLKSRATALIGWGPSCSLVRLISTLHSADFLEVQTPPPTRRTCPDTHIDWFEVSGRYLVTSTEYQLKRMIAGGFDRVFTLTQNFRRGESGPWHNPEFTMLEWARVFEPLSAIVPFCRTLSAHRVTAHRKTADNLVLDISARRRKNGAKREGR